MTAVDGMVDGEVRLPEASPEVIAEKRAEANRLHIANMTIGIMEEEGSAPVGEFDLPCGWLSPEGNLITRIRVREICGDEEDILASKHVAPERKSGLVLARCLEALGPHEDRKTIDNAVLEMTIGDRMFTLFAIRRVSLGDDLPFAALCPECDVEGVYISKLSELVVQKMANPMERVFDRILPSKKPVRFHVMTGKEEELLGREKGSADKLSLAILARLDLLDGKPINLQAVKKLGLRDRNYLRDQFEAIEGGLDMATNVICSSCGEKFEHEIQVDRSFFTPSALKISKKKSSR